MFDLIFNALVVCMIVLSCFTIIVCLMILSDKIRAAVKARKNRNRADILAEVIRCNHESVKALRRYHVGGFIKEHRRF